MEKFNIILMYPPNPNNPYQPNPYQPNPYQPDPYYQPNPYYQQPQYQQPYQQPPQPQPQQQEIGDQEIGIGNNKVGMSSKLKFNVKTGLFIMGVLWSLLLTFYTWTWIAEKNERKEANIELNNKIDAVAIDVREIEMQTARIEGQLDPVLNKTSNIDNQKDMNGGININNNPTTPINSSVKKENVPPSFTPPN
jgi:hypothetical protein